MSKSSQKLEIVTNISIIVVAVVLIGIIAQKYILGSSLMPPNPQQERLMPTVGKKVNLPEETWMANPKTIVLALQTTCRYCNESAPFYKRLVESAKAKNAKVIAVFPQSVEESTAHLATLGLSGIEVRQSPVTVLDTTGTPTLIITNQKGEIQNFWIGKLSPEKEAEVFEKVNS